jgi:dihydrofolate synthase / folylpolyglutamate synthase
LTQDPIDWLLSLEQLGMKFGLDNMARLVAAQGHPERTFRSIHVAGTNGKGSVTAMVDSALRAAGHLAARYTSPHLERLEERFAIAGLDVPTVELRGAVAKVRAVVEHIERTVPGFSPTFFECTTAAAFELFRQRQVQIAVLEAGLGGRLDATNVVAPVVAAITSIDFDHQALLGDTLESIAFEKAGIIKPAIPVVIGDLQPNAEAVIITIATERGAPVIRAAGASKRLPGLRPALAGRHQLDNSDVAVAVLDTLSAAGVGVDVPDASIRAGIEHVTWPGRLERITSGKIEILLDAAHNRAGARALAAHLTDTSWTDAALVFGAMRDKDVAGMLAELAASVSAIICTTAASPRAETAEQIAGAASAISGHPPVYIEPDPARAVKAAAALSQRVVIAGSIFLIGPLRGILR